MRIIISRLPNLVYAGIYATVPLVLLLALLYGADLRYPLPFGRMLRDYLGPVVYLIYLFIYLGCFIICYLYLSNKKPSYLEWQGECIYVGYRSKAGISINLKEIKWVEQWEPSTERLHKIDFKLDGREFTIDMDKKAAFSISKKLEESGIVVRYKFYE